MRAISDPDFTSYLRRIGNGAEPCIDKNNIRIPRPLLLPYTTEEESVSALIKHVFPDLNAFTDHNFSLLNRAILTTRNDFIDELNEKLKERFPGKAYQ